MATKQIIIEDKNGKRLNLDAGKKHIVYIGGKVSGLSPEEYHEKFEECRKFVEKYLPRCYQAVIPMDLCADDWEWFQCMEACVPVIKESIALILMPDWKESKGATCEKYIAEAAGIPVIELHKEGNLTEVERAWLFQNDFSHMLSHRIPSV